MKNNLNGRHLIAFTLGFSLAIIIGLIVPHQSFTSKIARTSVLMAQGDTVTDPSVDNSSTNDTGSQLSPEEELQYLNDAQTQLTTLKRDTRTFKTSLSKCNRKRPGTSKDDCITTVYEKMQESLQAICAYGDAFPDAMSENCSVLGDYIDSYDGIDVETEISPLLKDFMSAFGTRFFSAAQREINAQRADLEDLIGGGDTSSSSSTTDSGSTVDLGSQTATTSQGSADNQCFDHNYKSYLSGYCIDLRKSTVAK
ncbi:MAG: hypothetical protein NTX63_05180 [Candidatus Peregrinibacteria bacterium]|nr:hypothetical protein [Candidatus Peregrinibacteria bacterium]